MAFKHSISFATDLTVNFGCYRFRITPDIVSKLLRAAIRSRWAESNLSRRPFLGQVAFHLRPILLQTLVAIDSESCQTFFPSFCTPPSEVAVLFYLNLSPFLGQVVDLDLLLCTWFNLEHVILFLCHIFTQRPMNDHKVERSDSRCFGRQKRLAYSMEISFPLKTKTIVTARYLQSIKTFLNVELSQFRKSGSSFSSSEPAATAADSETPCVCARPSDHPSCAGARPQELLQSNPSIVFSNSLREWLPDDLHW